MLPSVDRARHVERKLPERTAPLTRVAVTKPRILPAVVASDPGVAGAAREFVPGLNRRTAHIVTANVAPTQRSRHVGVGALAAIPASRSTTQDDDDQDTSEHGEAVHANGVPDTSAR